MVHHPQCHPAAQLTLPPPPPLTRPNPHPFPNTHTHIHLHPQHTPRWTTVPKIAQQPGRLSFFDPFFPDWTCPSLTRVGGFKDGGKLMCGVAAKAKPGEIGGGWAAGRRGRRPVPPLFNNKLSPSPLSPLSSSPLEDSSPSGGSARGGAAEAAGAGPGAASEQLPCLIYSVGSQGDFQFESDVINRMGRDCEIHIFDPTVQIFDFTGPSYEDACGAASNQDFDAKAIVAATTVPKDKAMLTNALLFTSMIPEHVTFHVLGLGHKYLCRRGLGAGYFGPLMPLRDIMRALGHEGRRIDIFKVDCEGCEWRVFNDDLWAGDDCGGRGGGGGEGDEGGGAGVVEIGQLLIEVHAHFHMDDVTGRILGVDREHGMPSELSRFFNATGEGVEEGEGVGGRGGGRGGLAMGEGVGVGG